MKILARALTIALLAVMVFSLLPNMNAPVSAANIPVLVLDSSTATASILDHILEFDVYKAGGPFTVTYEWKCNLKPISAAVLDVYASVQSIGTLYGTMTEQPDSGIRITGDTDWTKVSYTFQNVGTYPMVGSNIPGNVFRFRIHDAKGQLYVKNLVIRNAAGTVLYNLNEDATVAQLMDQMVANGLTQADMSELGAINFDNCPWMANQFDSGKYTSYIMLDNATVETTTTRTRPTTTKATTTAPTTTKATTTKATTTKATTTKATTAPTTKTTTAPTTRATTAPTTRATTTKATTVPVQSNSCANGVHQYANGSCQICGLTDPNFNYCAINGHEFVNGYCKRCLVADPSVVPPTTPTPTSVPIQHPSSATQSTNSGPIMQGTTTGDNSTVATTRNDRSESKRDNDRNENNGMDPFVLMLLLGVALAMVGGIAFLLIKVLKKN